MKSQGREQGGARTLLKMMREATERGHYTAADVYPYLAGQTGLGALLVPAWAQDGGRDAMLERFKDPPQRTRIVSEIEQALAARFGGACGRVLLRSPHMPSRPMSGDRARKLSASGRVHMIQLASYPKPRRERGQQPSLGRGRSRRDCRKARTNDTHAVRSAPRFRPNRSSR